MSEDRIRVLSELDAHDGGFDVTNARTLRALRDAEDRHFWHRTRNELIAQRLGRLGGARGSISEANLGATSQLQGRRRSSRGDVAAPGATVAAAMWGANALTCRIERPERRAERP